LWEKEKTRKKSQGLELESFDESFTDMTKRGLKGAFNCTNMGKNPLRKRPRASFKAIDHQDAKRRRIWMNLFSI
jgi:hypothetical protein